MLNYFIYYKDNKWGCTIRFDDKDIAKKELNLDTIYTISDLLDLYNQEGGYVTVKNICHIAEQNGEI